MTSTSLNKTLEYLGINVSSLKQSQIDSASKFLKQIGCFLVSIAVGNSESIGKHIPKEFRETEGVTKTLKEYLAPIQKPKESSEKEDPESKKPNSLATFHDLKQAEDRLSKMIEKSLGDLKISLSDIMSVNAENSEGGDSFVNEESALFGTLFSESAAKEALKDMKVKKIKKKSS